MTEKTAEWYNPEKHEIDKEYLEWCTELELEPAEEPLHYKPKGDLKSFKESKKKPMFKMEGSQ